MDGERDLARLIADLNPRVADDDYVFCCLPDRRLPEGVTPWATVAEDEGLTAVVRRDAADAAGLAYAFVARRITLQVHSALDAVGLTAAVATTLAARGISCNVIAGALHDHLFVPAERVDDAMSALSAISDR